MLKSAKRSREDTESESVDAADTTYNDPILFGDPIIEIFHRLPPTSFVGLTAIGSVCRNWHGKLQQNGSWRRKVTQQGFVNDCKAEELITLLSNGEAFRLFSFSTILDLLARHSTIASAWQRHTTYPLPLTEEEKEALSLQEFLVDNPTPLYLGNTCRFINDILSDPIKYLPEDVSSEQLLTLAMVSPRIALYILDHYQNYKDQLNDEVLCTIGESHPLVAMKILETPALASILDGSHFVSLCYHGQAKLTDFVLKTPRLINICIEEDLQEICRIKKLCSSLQTFAKQYAPEPEIQDVENEARKKSKP